ncbi:phage tail protein [Massilia sp. Root418]|jgi:microcystin-dependent protein|uniref:phage tail protein n=1 Tax=Massilia sp. Root418 TaxID=1736532 RepID=UPI0006F2205B|nr:tail fiber protein [Massilia sp. Root418]KQW93338.1 phage tail protein [Massilia sp. Root418]
MAQPYVGEIRLFAGNFAPNGWLFCDGRPLAISENETLFQLIGTTYGGDGQETFNLPDLQGRVPLHQGQGPGGAASYQIGERAGVESVTLTVQQIPAHSHLLFATTSRASPAYSGKTGLPGSTGGVPAYALAGSEQTAMRAGAAGSSGATGGSQPHNNMAPSLGLNYIISLFGLFPRAT